MPDATTEIQVAEPGEHPQRSSKLISGRRLDIAARELNLLNVSSKRLTSTATVGRFVNELGLLQYGNGRLLGSAATMQESAMLCGEMARREDISDEARQSYLELQLRFLKAIDDNMALQLETNNRSKKAPEASSMPQGKPFLPGAQISPIQINISPGATATVSEKSTKEVTCKT